MPEPQPTPDEIWEAAVDEGERRVGRSNHAIISAAFVGGADVMIGVTAMVSIAGSLAASMDGKTADTLGGFFFGIGFVVVAIGRGELFTENFLIPFAAAFARRARVADLVRLYGLSLIANLAGVGLFAWMLSRARVLDHSALEAVGRFGETYAGRNVGAAFLSAVVAGALITLWTWMSEATDSAIGRITIAFLVGLAISVSSLNHVVVVTGTMVFAKLANTSTVEWIDIYRNFAVAIIGNIVGGVGFVTLTRVVQAKGEEG